MNAVLKEKVEEANQSDVGFFHIDLKIDGNTSIVSNVQAAVGQLKEKIGEKVEGCKLLLTDDDLDNAKTEAKNMRVTQKKCDAFIVQIDEANVTVAETKALLKEAAEICRKGAVEIEKTVDARKQFLIDELKQKYNLAWQDKLNEYKDKSPVAFKTDVNPDFDKSVYGKSKLANMELACKDELELAVSNADAIIERLKSNHNLLISLAGDNLSLFADQATLLYKPVEEFTNEVKSRLVEFEAKRKREIEAAAAEKVKQARISDNMEFIANENGGLYVGLFSEHEYDLEPQAFRTMAKQRIEIFIAQQSEKAEKAKEHAEAAATAEIKKSVEESKPELSQPSTVNTQPSQEVKTLCTDASFTSKELLDGAIKFVKVHEEARQIIKSYLIEIGAIKAA